MSNFITDTGERLPYEITQVRETWAMARWYNGDGPARLIVKVEWKGIIRRIDTKRTVMEGETLNCRLKLSAF